MKSCVTCIIPPVDLPDVFFKTVQDNILQRKRNNKLSQQPFKKPVKLLLVNIKGYLVTQAGGALQQSLSRVFINNQPTNLGGNRLLWWRVWAAASSWWAFLFRRRGWEAVWSRWGGAWTFSTTIIIRGEGGTTFPQTNSFGFVLKWEVLNPNCKRENMIRPQGGTVILHILLFMSPYCRDGSLPSAHRCHTSVCFWTSSFLKAYPCTLESLHSPDIGTILSEWTMLS